MVAHGAGDTKAARLGQSLQPRRHIDPVAENVALIDNDVAEIDADAKADALLLSGVSLAVEHAARDADASGLSEAVVLLSPACASFDQYRNFEVRGDKFRELVRALPGLVPSA